jgi:hypothetical protein
MLLQNWQRQEEREVLGAVMKPSDQADQDWQGAGRTLPSLKRIELVGFWCKAVLMTTVVQCPRRVRSKSGGLGSSSALPRIADAHREAAMGSVPVTDLGFGCTTTSPSAPVTT